MTTPSNDMTTRATTGGGFIAALDQSGGSTPGALRQYGIEESSYSGDQEMYRLMHEMRVRIMSAPAFTGEKVIGAILFERTMDGRRARQAGADVPLGRTRCRAVSEGGQGIGVRERTAFS